MATLNKHASPRARTTAVRDGDQTAETRTTRTARAGHRRAKPPRSRLGYAAGVSTVCALALVNMLAGQPATATMEPTGSVAVAEALGIDATQAPLTATPEDAEALGQLAASRAERDEDQAAAALSQARAEREAAAAKAEAERVAAEAAAAAAAAAAEAEAAAAAAQAEAAEAEAAAETSVAGTAVTRDRADQQLRGIRPAHGAGRRGRGRQQRAGRRWHHHRRHPRQRGGPGRPPLRAWRWTTWS